MKKWSVHLTHILLICLCITMTASNIRDNIRLTIVHTNDMHMHFDEAGGTLRECSHGAKCFGGISRLTHFINMAQSYYSNVLIVDSGDMVETDVIKQPAGMAIVKDLLEPLPYDVMALGVSEVAAGVDVLADYVRLMKKKFVCTNLRFSKSTDNGKFLSEKCQRSTVIMFGWLKVGIVSYVKQDLMKHPPPGITILNEIEALNKELIHLHHAYYVKTVVALGYSNDIIDKQLLQSVPGLSLVISGHAHGMFYKGIPPSGSHRDFDYPEIFNTSSSINPHGSEVLLVGAYFHLYYVGKLKLIFDMDNNVKADRSSNPAFLDGKKDQNTEVILARHRANLTAMLGGIIGQNVFMLDGSRHCWLSECSMGNVLADAMVDFVATDTEQRTPNFWSSIGTALLRSDMISSTLMPGNVILSEVEDLLKVDSTVEVVTLRGRELRALLDRMVGEVANQTQYGGFLQLSGLQVHGVVGLPAHRRLLSVRILCVNCYNLQYEDLRDNSTYKVVMSGNMVDTEQIPGVGMLADEIDGERRHKIADSLVNVSLAYFTRFSPVVKYVGDRIVLTQLPKVAASVRLAAPAWCLLAPLLAIARTGLMP